jgi:ribosomal protein L11 methyltransferase
MTEVENSQAGNADDASATFVVGLTASEREARTLADLLSETVDAEIASVSVFETAPGQWRVSLHCASAAEAEPLRSLLADLAGVAPTAIAIERLAERDWVAASLAGLSPVAAGRFLVHGAHDRARIKPNVLAIELEAGLAFGTGHHGTTRGCLLALDTLLKTRRPRRVLDVGTGTGVLAIAAAKAMRRPVLASDIDRRAVSIARVNARANRVGGLVEAIHAKGVVGARFSQRGPYDLILANILLAPLQRLAAPLAALIAPGGRIVLSGLLTAHAEAALAFYRMQGLLLERRIRLEGWTTLVLKRGRL